MCLACGDRDAAANLAAVPPPLPLNAGRVEQALCYQLTSSPSLCRMISE
jgi:hypothetical protein